MIRMSEKELEEKLEEQREPSEKLKGKKVNIKLAKKSVSTSNFEDGFDNGKSDVDDMKMTKENGKWKMILLNEDGNIVERRYFSDKFIAMRVFYWKKYPEVCINGMCTDSKNNHCEMREQCHYWKDNKDEIKKRWPFWEEEMKK